MGLELLCEGKSKMAQGLWVSPLSDMPGEVLVA